MLNFGVEMLNFGLGMLNFDLEMLIFVESARGGLELNSRHLRQLQGTSRAPPGHHRHLQGTTGHLAEECKC